MPGITIQKVRVFLEGLSGGSFCNVFANRYTKSVGECALGRD